MKFEKHFHQTKLQGRMKIPGEVERVIDGDTVVCYLLVMPTLELKGVHIRVEGINAPEMNTAEGRAAKDYAASILPAGLQIIFDTKGNDKYGRALGYIILPDLSNFSLLMIDNGHAVPYMV